MSDPSRPIRSGPSVNPRAAFGASRYGALFRATQAPQDVPGTGQGPGLPGQQHRACLAVSGLDPDARTPHVDPMNYILALLLPPLSILLAGRPIVAIITFLVWVPALIFSGGLTHPMFIILAWILVWEGRNRDLT